MPKQHKEYTIDILFVLKEGKVCHFDRNQRGGIEMAKFTYFLE